MDEKLADLRERFTRDLALVSSPDDLASIRDKYLGRKSGLIAAEKKRVGSLSPEERASFGRDVNELNALVEGEIARLGERFSSEAGTRALERERIDVTLPGRRPDRGHLHPLTLVRQRLEDIFVSMGYTVEEGPEIETSF
ncbi:MAG TPA: phenylalanine--tRNA ligase subunit alpha, partial [Blastocatellia bacterium]|nr:phenylalanine--tRNA ligase subunit alpha [Blastocatellia bacterium]